MRSAGRSSLIADLARGTFSRALALLAALVSTAPAQSADIEHVVDDAGRSVAVLSPGARVVTLAPSLTELVYAVGAGAALVGTVGYSDYPAAARTLPRIGDFQRFDVERILALKPDLVLVWNHGNPGREVGQLEAAGLRLFYLEPRRLDDVAVALERVGVLLGHAAQGRARARELRTQIDRLRRKHADVAPVAVFYQAWANPLMTLGGGQIVSDVIELCGGRNVFASLPQLAPQLSTESVVAAAPEAFLVARETPAERPGAERDPHNPAFATWLRHPHLVAVRQRWLYTLPGDAITRQGPRIIEGARAVCAALDQVRQERDSKPR